MFLSTILFWLSALYMTTLIQRCFFNFSYGKSNFEFFFLFIFFYFFHYLFVFLCRYFAYLAGWLTNGRLLNKEYYLACFNSIMVKLFVGGLPEGVDSIRLRQLFSQFVLVNECDVIKDYAFVVSLFFLFCFVFRFFLFDQRYWSLIGVFTGYSQ